MQNNRTKVLGTLTLLSSLFAAHAFADIQILGSESEISQSITEHYQQSTQFYNGHLAKTDLLYINVGTASDDDIAQAKSHVVKGDTVVIDLKQVSGDDAKIELSQSLTGLGSDAPVVVTGMYQGDNIINSIVADVRDENGEPVNNPSAELESIKQSLVHALDRLGFGGE
ncbi:cytolysin secretion protein [Vibrio sp. Isolate25]|uniref:cytolysin secretion protein n=1 Tax=Vibrio TaxID=662 RepID=UPI001EFDFB25|nr:MULTISPECIES: cytolysin secretion protein [Vibrio]MCG9597442.1 cytolysin secretion protein [Vibrio sp. Isolate25]USD33938.1 cytolysin secretion protein [Vibrio sp. SCSIO 43186]USD47040.1 cytolysin secretion protein [Vibrio sp. SCSIO 43145]USD71062.1 cytolysin secretion protein [Vibrio sp. SCSIO 43139]USD95968.1 cytolysin secretion protein [Vibrio coralliilyticus]